MPLVCHPCEYEAGTSCVPMHLPCKVIVALHHSAVRVYPCVVYVKHHDNVQSS